MFFRRSRDPLGHTLLRWPSGDIFSLEDALRGVAVMGATGTGKSSSVALAIARAILRTNAGGLVLCSKPEDCPWWLARLKEAGRLNDAVVFDEHGGERCNLLAFEAASGKQGAVSRDLTRILMTMREVIGGGKGMQEEPWRSLNERIIYSTIVPLLAAYGTADAPLMRRFLDAAPTHPSQLSDPAWLAGFCNQTLERANARCKPGIEAFDLAQANAFWPGEWCQMDERPRSSGLIGVNNCLFLFNSGLVRLLCATESTFTPACVDDGKWIICNLPPSQFGEAGKVIGAGLKYVTQRHVLRRSFTPGDPPCFFVSDEAQNFVNSQDAAFCLESRSHGGALMILSQSISNYQDKLGKEAADMLLGQLATKIFTPVDPATAAWASSLVGSCLQETYGGSQAAPSDTMDEMMGQGKWSSSVNQGVRPELEPQAFMRGRTGGIRNKLCVDSWVVRLGVPFSNGSAAIPCVWSQK